MFSLLCVLLLMAYPWRISASAAASTSSSDINSINQGVVSTTSTVNATLHPPKLPPLPTASIASSATASTTTKKISTSIKESEDVTGIARLKEALLLSEANNNNNIENSIDKKAVGHLDIFEASPGSPGDDELLSTYNPEKKKDKVKYASGVWLMRSKRSSNSAASSSNYLHNNMPWKRRERRPSNLRKSSQMSSKSENHHPSYESVLSSSSDYQNSISDSESQPASSSSSSESQQFPAEEMLMAAGRSMAVQMMKKRRPPGHHGGRMYDVPQIECPRSEDRMERFACPSPDFRGRYRCIDDRSLCDGFFDCPSREDENPEMCLFYKTTKAHLDILAEALLRWARGR